ncbi:MAG: hypothetical protein C0594_06755, partial [Marinilabiliales bacterium]
MHKTTYRKEKMQLSMLILIVFSLLFTNCKKEEDNVVNSGPTLSFITEQGYLSSDTTMKMNDSVKIGLTGTSGTENLTLFKYTITTENGSSSVDSGFNAPSFDYSKIIVKGISETEEWLFMIRDKDGLSAEVSLTLTKDTSSEFGNIIHISSIQLGAHNNQTIGSFYSINEEQVYLQADAFNNQSFVDILYFYDEVTSDENTISSPGANIDASVFDGPSGLDNWTEINTTRYVKQDFMSVSEFDQCANDSLILATTFEYPQGKRKCKNLVANDIYSFILNNDGRKG